MIGRLRRTTKEQRKLVLSLGTNFLTRIPGAIGVLWFLPLLRFGLGIGTYADLLTSMALGNAAAFLVGGFSIVGRRLIGEAYSEGNHAREADGFASVVVANAAALVVALSIIAAYCWIRDIGTVVLVASTLPAFAIFLNTFDNVRSAYNEHYITATLLIILQSLIYLFGFLVPATRHSLLLGALVLASPYMLASLLTLALLLRDRSYLLGGRPVTAWGVARQGTMLAMADGFVMATLSLSVVWLQAMATAETSAWFATEVRLFQTFLVPVVLLLLPLSSYIRILWNSKSAEQRHAFARATLAIGVGYGALVATALFLASHLYVELLLHLPTPGSLLEVLPVFLLFGAIVAYKSYSSIAYMVLEDSAYLSTSTTVVVALAVALGVAASFRVEPLSTIVVYASAAGASIIAVLFWNAARFVRSTPIAT